MKKLIPGFIKLLIAAVIPGLILSAGCSPNRKNNIPADFYFILDARSPEPGASQNVNIQVDVTGEGLYEYYETGGVLQYDYDGEVTYRSDQVTERGEFKLSEEQLIQLWESIQQNKFFDLTGEYRMAIGHSYAFILVQADGKRNMVDNIGMEVPEIRIMIDDFQSLLPEEVDLEYGEGYMPQ